MGQFLHIVIVYGSRDQGHYQKPQQEGLRGWQRLAIAKPPYERVEGCLNECDRREDTRVPQAASRKRAADYGARTCTDAPRRSCGPGCEQIAPSNGGDRRKHGESLSKQRFVHSMQERKVGKAEVDEAD